MNKLLEITCYDQYDSYRESKSHGLSADTPNGCNHVGMLPDGRYARATITPDHMLAVSAYKDGAVRRTFSFNIARSAHGERGYDHVYYCTCGRHMLGIIGHGVMLVELWELGEGE